ncbi:hypothetical protein RBA39_22875, partial [Mycobacteroides abscessus subsp. massiliense]
MFAITLSLVLTGCAQGTTFNSWPPSDDRGPCAVAKKSDVPATMRDGTILRADIYRPKLKD